MYISLYPEIRLLDDNLWAPFILVYTDVQPSISALGSGCGMTGHHLADLRRLKPSISFNVIIPRCHR